jgi:hypothetical protein
MSLSQTETFFNMDSWHQFFLLPVAPVLCLLFALWVSPELILAVGAPELILAVVVPALVLLVAQWVAPEQILAAVAPTLALFLALLVKMLTFFFVTDDKI